jgi:DNA-directed RNA polymerase alpha subunit
MDDESLPRIVIPLNDEVIRELYRACCNRLGLRVEGESLRGVGIDELSGLSLRTVNCLRRNDIRLISDLTVYSAEDLLHIQGFGEKSLREVREKLSDVGLSLKNDHRPV